MTLVARETYTELRDEEQRMHDAPCIEVCANASAASVCRARDIATEQHEIVRSSGVRIYQRVCGLTPDGGEHTGIVLEQINPDPRLGELLEVIARSAVVGEATVVIRTPGE